MTAADAVAEGAAVAVADANAACWDENHNDDQDDHPDRCLHDHDHDHDPAFDGDLSHYYGRRMSSSSMMAHLCCHGVVVFPSPDSGGVLPSDPLPIVD